MSICIAEVVGGVRVPVLVQPRASRSRLGPIHGDRIKLAITTAPVDGAANEAVIRLLAKTFGVAKRDVRIVCGLTSRAKTIELQGVARDAVEAALR